MRFLLLLCEDEQVWAGLRDAHRDEYLRRHDDFAAAVRARGTIVSAEALAPVAAATTLRRDDDRLAVTEGPFAETVEQVGGFYLVDLPDLDAVLDAVALLPPYTVEVRPVVDVDDL
ncbi:YciI family protein [Cellulosimicrobium sp. PMB13]|uniref:YciI family protein n=1 Tax=Cellulosimicrobium sp. PMB13 TaxID=3120158 RepID=UPI003F4B68EB